MTKQIKTVIDKFLLERYDHLNEMARLITRRRAVDSQDKDEVFSYMVEHLYRDQKAWVVAEQGQANLEAYSVAYMKNTWKWGNTPNQKWRAKSTGELADVPTYDYQIDDREIKMATRVDKLEPHEKRLYELYFVDGLSTRKIGAMTRLSYVAIYKMLLIVKDKLKNGESGLAVYTSQGKTKLNSI